MSLESFTEFPDGMNEVAYSVLPIFHMYGKHDVQSRGAEVIPELTGYSTYRRAFCDPTESSVQGCSFSSTVQ